MRLYGFTNIMLIVALTFMCGSSQAKIHSSKKLNAKAKINVPAKKVSKSRKVVKRVSKPEQHPMGAKLGTDYNINEMSVRGRYESSLAGIATVENEKQTRELIDYRSDFKSRLQKSLTQK